MKPRILFLCTGNSARSQLAEAIARDRLGEQFDIFSAGSAPEQVDDRTIEVLNAHNYNSHGLTAQSIHEFADIQFDFVITLCERASKECANYAHAEQMLAWDLVDPKPLEGTTGFTNTLQELERRLDLFAEVHGSNNLDPVLNFHKQLSEELRLRCVLLLCRHNELNVSELIEALQQMQPKVSRSLRQLRQHGILADRRQAQKVYYRLSPNLAPWQLEIIELLARSHRAQLKGNEQLLEQARTAN